MKVVLGNIDYRMHTTDEGEQLQAGLVRHGWEIAGRGYDERLDCAEILEHYQPQMVMVQDKRDWDPRCSGSFRKDLGFTNLAALRRSGVIRVCPVKDAGTSIPYQEGFVNEIGANVVLTYYHDNSVLPHSVFLRNYARFRMYHSLDADYIFSLDMHLPRKEKVVSGATSKIYPLREMAFQRYSMLGVYRLGHPGYGNAGNHTPNYLFQLSQYKVHLATASRFGFALRKIIESVAVGCTPVTNLPKYDVLPEIDGALVRVPDDIGVRALGAVLDREVANWNLEQRMVWSRKALAFYDWKVQGKRTAEALNYYAEHRSFS